MNDTKRTRTVVCRFESWQVDVMVDYVADAAEWVSVGNLAWPCWGDGANNIVEYSVKLCNNHGSERSSVSGFMLTQRDRNDPPSCPGTVLALEMVEWFDRKTTRFRFVLRGYRVSMTYTFAALSCYEQWQRWRSFRLAKGPTLHRFWANSELKLECCERCSKSHTGRCCLLNRTVSEPFVGIKLAAW